MCPNQSIETMAEKIVGRHQELNLLSQYFHSGKAEFIAMYGRRRVGKTFLIRQYFKNQFSFDMTGVLEGNKHEQMTAFHMALKTYGYKGRKNQTWLDAFFALRQLLENKLQDGKRCVVFIDELPCLDTPKAGFIHALGHFWNSWANWRSEIMLIVCGSATSWMVRNIIDDHGGLHDRVTHEMPLHPFTLAETEEYFRENGFRWKRLSLLQVYMAIGGVPYYMSLFHPSESPAMGIDRLFFAENAELEKEYRRLFFSLFRNAQPYQDIISLLSKKSMGMTRQEISKALKVDNNGKLGDMLTDLVYCDFIRKYNVREKTVKMNSALYQLTDFYTLFYHAFATKNGKDEHFWSRNATSSKVKSWCGLAFERVCQAHMPQIKKALGIFSVRTEHYSWRSKTLPDGAQIDIIIDRADDTINLCEVKYSDHQYSLDKEEYFKICHRQEAFEQETGTVSTVLPTMITTFGLAEGMYSDQIPVKLTLDDLFC